MTDQVDRVTVRGRTFGQEEIARVRDIIANSRGESRRAISQKVSIALHWFQENGAPKDRSCRALLLKLHAAGSICLPKPRTRPPYRRPVPLTGRTDPRLPVPVEPMDVGLEQFRIVSGKRPEERLWNEFIERYHYLGHGVPVGPNLKYFVEVHREPVACLAFSGAAWKVSPRDTWIGWTRQEREANLRFVVNNTRFLILPWFSVKNLASRILSLAVKRLPEDWFTRYAYRPLLLETFVHADRHVGTCYKASNWICVGETQGRGKMDRFAERKLPKKLMFVHALTKHARARLASSAPAVPAVSNR